VKVRCAATTTRLGNDRTTRLLLWNLCTKTPMMRGLQVQGVLYKVVSGEAHGVLYKVVSGEAHASQQSHRVWCRVNSHIASDVESNDGSEAPASGVDSTVLGVEPLR
jgi:cation transport regulator ChaC